MHLATAQQILLGALPVRDYVERGIPLQSVVSAAAQALLGPGLAAEVQLVALAFAAAAVLTFVAATVLSRSIVVGAAAAAITVVVYPASYSYPKLLAYALVFLAAIAYARRPSTPRLTAIALAVVVAFLFRHDHGIILGGGVAAMLFALHGTTRDSLRALATFALAGLVLVSPYLVWIQVHEGLATYVADGLAFSRREAERSSRFAVPRMGIDATQPLFRTIEGGPIVNVRWRDDAGERLIREREAAHGVRRLDPVGEQTWQYELRRWSRSALEQLVRDPAVADTHGIDRQRYRLGESDPGLLRRVLVGMTVPAAGMRLRANGLAVLFYLAWAIPAIAAIVLMARWKQMGLEARGAVVLLIVVQAAMNVSMLRDPLDLRIRDVVVPMAVGLGWVFGQARVGARSRMLGWTGCAASGLLVLVTLSAAAAVGPADERLQEAGVLDGADGIQRRRAELRAEFSPPAQRTGTLSDDYRALVDYVTDCVPANGRLLALTFVPELFVYTGRGFAGGQVTLTPGYYVTDRHASLMLERLSREDVPMVVMDSETEAEMLAGYPRVAAHVAGAYERIAEFPISGDKRLVVLGERARPVLRTHGTGRLPCYAAAA